MVEGTKPTTSKQEVTASMQEGGSKCTGMTTENRLTGYDGCFFKLPEYIIEAVEKRRNH